MLKRSVNTKQCREKGLQTLRQLLARQYSKYLYKWLQEVSVEKQAKKLPTDNSSLFCDESGCNYFLYDKLHLRAIRELCSNFIHARTDGTVSEATEEILIVTTVYFNTTFTEAAKFTFWGTLLWLSLSSYAPYWQDFQGVLFFLCVFEHFCLCQIKSKYNCQS